MRTYLKAAAFACALLVAGVGVSPSAQYQIQRGFSVVGDFLIFGSATTAGVRLDLESGTLAVREGNDSTYAPLAVGALSATTGSFTGIVSGFTDLYSTAWTDYSATSTVTGWTTPTKSIFYKRVGKLVYVVFSITGTSNATSATFTLPVASASTGPTLTFPLSGEVADNGAAVETNAYGALGTSSSTVSTAKSAAAAAWTNTGTKTISGQFWYESQ